MLFSVCPYFLLVLLLFVTSFFLYLFLFLILFPALELMGDAVVPEVHVLEEEIEFGGVTIGATMRQPLRLENRGTIPAILFIDLERHPEFTVEMDPKQLMAMMARALVWCRRRASCLRCM